jgi:hypothetical protein
VFAAADLHNLMAGCEGETDVMGLDEYRFQECTTVRML